VASLDVTLKAPVATQVDWSAKPCPAHPGRHLYAATCGPATI